jgi:hypothetical protein
MPFAGGFTHAKLGFAPPPSKPAKRTGTFGSKEKVRLRPAVTVLSCYFHHTGTPFTVAKYPQVKWSSLSPKQRDHPLPPTSLIGVLGFFYSVAYFIVASLHKIMHMKNNVHGFHFFAFYFSLGFHMMASSTWPLRFECEVFKSFPKFYKVQSGKVRNQDPYQQKELEVSNDYKHKV